MSASTSTGKVRDYESQLRGHTVLILKTETGLIAKSLCTEGTYSRYFKVYVSDTFGNYQNLTVTDAVGACDVLVHRPPVFRNLSAAISQKGYSPMSYLGQKMPDKEIPKGTPGTSITLFCLQLTRCRLPAGNFHQMCERWYSSVCEYPEMCNATQVKKMLAGGGNVPAAGLPADVAAGLPAAAAAGLPAAVTAGNSEVVELV